MKENNNQNISKTINLFFIIAYFLSGLIINGLAIYHTKVIFKCSNSPEAPKVYQLKKSDITINKIIMTKNFKFYLRVHNKYAIDITESIFLIAFINIFFLVFYLLLFIFLKHKFKNFLIENEKEQLLNFRKFENSLESKIILSIAENLHHEIKTPLISLKNALLEYNKIFEITIKALKNNDCESLKKIYLSNNNTLENCNICPYKDVEFPTCEYYSYFELPAEQTIKELRKIIKSSIHNIFQTISITKTIKSFKNKDTKLSIYDVASQAYLIFNIIQKYKFKCNIDEKLKYCYLNGLAPDILLNIFINHIKNSLEAKSSSISFKFIDYIEEKNKKFVLIEIIDNGHGISQKIKDKIFNLHFSSKTDNSNKKIRGVGLYLSKNILKYFGGDEWLEFTSIQGTIFRLKIPIKECKINIKENK